MFIGTEASALTLVGGTESTGVSYNAANSRSGMSLAGSGQQVYGELPTALPTVNISWQGLYWGDSAGYNVIIAKDGAGADLFRLVAAAGTNTWQMQAWISGAWVNQGAAVAVGLVNTRGPYQLRIVAGASGRAMLYANGVLMLNQAIAFAGTTVKRVIFYNGDDSWTAAISEVIINDDTTLLIGAIVETEAPTSDGVDVDGTGTWAAIDEVPYSDGDTVALPTAGNRHSFKSPARTSTLANVLGVGVAMRMSCDVSGPQNAKFYLTIGGLRYYSPTFALSTGMVPYQYCWKTNPATGLTWTAGDANAATLEWGVEAVA
ncbi:MAG: hypothetical protein ABIO43_08320 [Sphingomicrobium sp.]